MITAATLADAIRSSFAVQPMPAPFFQDGVDTGHEISIDLMKKLHGKPWTDVTQDDWAYIGNVAVIKDFITPDTMRYYMPSLLLIGLEQTDSLHLAFEVILPSNQKRTPKGDWWQAYFMGFTPAQKQVLRDYASYALSTSQPEDAETFSAQQVLELWK